MRRSLFLASVVLLVAAPSVLAQDAAKVEPNHYKVEFENSRVRVLRVKIGPHEKSAMHSHPDAVIVVLSGGKTKFTFRDGKTEERDLATGDTRWTPAVIHRPENISDQPMEVIVIELKKTVIKRRPAKKPVNTSTQTNNATQ